MTWQHTLSDDDFKMIGQITVNWGIAESLLGSAIVVVMSISDTFIVNMMHNFDMVKKEQIIRKLHKTGRLKSGADSLLAELTYCMEHLKYSRNTISHGIPIFNIGDRSVVLRNKSGKDIDRKDLESVLEHSEYVLDVCEHFFSMAHGHQHTVSLRDRPPPLHR